MEKFQRARHGAIRSFVTINSIAKQPVKVSFDFEFLENRLEKFRSLSALRFHDFFRDLFTSDTDEASEKKTHLGFSATINEFSEFYQKIKKSQLCPLLI
jgi:hypothetical protein